jgi:hypothetical protein
MNYLNDETKDEILKLIKLAEERLTILKSVAFSARSDEDMSGLRIAINDVMTPLSLAGEALL